MFILDINIYIYITLEIEIYILSNYYISHHYLPTLIYLFL